MDFTGTSGNDHLIGTKDADHFNMQQAGDDTVEGRGGDDIIDFGQAFDNNDHVFGGNGTDTLMLSGGHDVHAFLTLDSIEQIVVADGFSYGFQFAASTIAAHHTMTVDASALTVGHMLDFEDQPEDGNLIVKGGSFVDIEFSGHGNDVLYGGDGSDVLNPGDGSDRVYAGAGSDAVNFSSAGKLDATDRIDGGADGATISLSGDYSAGLTLGAHTVVNVDHFTLSAGFDYTLDFHRMGPPDQLITIDGDALGAANVLNFTGAGSRAGFNVYGGGGDDIITLSNVEGDAHGNMGADRIVCGTDTDTLFYNAGTESDGAAYDTVVGFDTRDDFFNLAFTGLNGHVEGVDPTVKHGTLSRAHLETNLASTFGDLGSYHAVLFHPDAGNLAGEWFLIVDANGEAGYQGADDMVVHLVSPVQIAGLSAANFGTPG